MKAFIYEKYGPPRTLRMAKVDKSAPDADEANQSGTLHRVSGDLAQAEGYHRQAWS